MGLRSEVVDSFWNLFQDEVLDGFGMFVGSALGSLGMGLAYSISPLDPYYGEAVVVSKLEIWQLTNLWNIRMPQGMTHLSILPGTPTTTSSEGSR